MVSGLWEITPEADLCFRMNIYKPIPIGEHTHKEKCFSISVFIHSSISSQIFSFQKFVSFLLFLLLMSIFNPGVQIKYSELFQFSCICLDFVYKYVVSFGESSMRFSQKNAYSYKIKYILLCLGEMFCKYPLGPFGLWCQLAPAFPHLVFVCMTCLLTRLRYQSLPLSVCEDKYVI